MVWNRKLLNFESRLWSRTFVWFSKTPENFNNASNMIALSVCSTSLATCYTLILQSWAHGTRELKESIKNDLTVINFDKFRSILCWLNFIVSKLTRHVKCFVKPCAASFIAGLDFVVSNIRVEEVSVHSYTLIWLRKAVSLNKTLLSWFLTLLDQVWAR